MRWINRLTALAAVLALSGVAAMAQSQECTEDFKTATYTKWYENKTDHQDIAYQAATQYLTVCPNEPADNPYVKVLKKFKSDYEALNANKKLGAEFQDAINKKNYKDVFRIAKTTVASDPSNTKAYLWIGFAGLNEPSVLSEAAQYAAKAIDLVETGKPFEPYDTKDKALASMNYAIAKSKSVSAPIDSIPYFIKAVKYESDLKKDARVYNELAAAHGERVAKLTADYQPNIGKPETTESKLILANLNQAIDLQIDALARATALADAANKPALMERLTELYKFRNKSDAGLNELVARVLTKPIPDLPTPITTLPTPPATPSATGSGSAAPGTAAPMDGGQGSSTAKPSTTVSTTAPKTGTSTTTSTSTKPAPTSTPKPKPRRNHRGR